MDLNASNGRLHIVLPSLLGLPEASELRDALVEALNQEAGSDVVLNGAGVERASTAAIQVILAASDTFSGADRRLAMEAPSDPLRAAFGHLGLTADLDKLVTS